MKYFKTVLMDEINEITEFMYIYCIIIYCYVANYPKTQQPKTSSIYLLSCTVSEDQESGSSSAELF